MTRPVINGVSPFSCVNVKDRDCSAIILFAESLRMNLGVGAAVAAGVGRSSFPQLVSWIKRNVKISRTGRTRNRLVFSWFSSINCLSDLLIASLCGMKRRLEIVCLLALVGNSTQYL